MERETCDLSSEWEFDKQILVTGTPQLQIKTIFSCSLQMTAFIPDQSSNPDQIADQSKPDLSPLIILCGDPFFCDYISVA